MCGIAGIADWSDRPIVEAAVTRMCDRLAHRGPDDAGIYTDHRVVLGQRRLSIIDLSHGHQPLCNEDGSLWLVMNGEIYNYKELRRDLLARGHRFNTSTDTEVIVHLYEVEGIELLRRLNGMFAFALWDSNRRVLFLVRDRIGIKPLYYSIVNGKLSFASEMKALLDGARTLDREAIADYLTLGYIPEPDTPFTEIRKLGRGSYLECSKRGFQEKRYWEVPICTTETRPSLGDLCEEIRFLIQDSTRLQLQADVPVGLFASGGIDSTAIMWAAAKQGLSLKAFLAEFDSLAEDTPYARVAAAETGMEVHERRISSGAAWYLLPKLVWHLDEPLADPAIIPCFAVARSAAEGVKVILNGTGGDELFGGYPRYRVRSALPDRWFTTASFLTGLCEHAAADRASAWLNYRARYLRHIDVIREREVRLALGLSGEGRVSPRVRDLFARCRRSDRQTAMMYVDLNLYLPDDLCLLLDRTTMAASLEARVPLLDHRLVEFAASLPGQFKMRGGQMKWLLRQALRGYVPDRILDRPKQGFGPPVQAWLAGAVGDAALKLLTSNRCGLRYLLNPSQLAQWLAPQHRCTVRGAMRIWALLVLELWWQTFVEGGNCAASSAEELAAVSS